MDLVTPNLVISSYFNERYDDIQRLRSKLRSMSNKRKLDDGPPERRCSRRRTGSYRKFRINRNALRLLERHNKANHRDRDDKWCREYRRRRSQLVARQGTSSGHAVVDALWLPTHLWHTKRFQMKKQWNFILPQKSAARGQKFVWEKMRNGSVVHDASYIRPIQVEGNTEVIIGVLQALMDPLKKDWQKEINIDGICEQKVCFYKANSFPSQCIGPVILHFHPSVLDRDSNHSKLWVWCHPSIYDDVFGELVSGVDSLGAGEEPSATVESLSSQLCRFSIIGSLSATVLQRVLVPATLPCNAQGTPMGENGDFFLELLNSPAVGAVWKHGHVLGLDVIDCRELKYSTSGKTDVREENPYKRWDKTSDISDPRHSSALPGQSQWLKWPETAPMSGLYSELCRKQCTEEMISTSALNAHRHKQRESAWTLPTGVRGDASGTWTATGTPKSQESCKTSVQTRNVFPILLVRNHGSSLCSEPQGSVLPRKSTSYGHKWPHKRMKSAAGVLPSSYCGWDIIAPAAWACVLWQALTYAGACAVGQDEMNLIYTASKIPAFPRDYPDTKAGLQYWKELEKSLNNLRSKRPSRKKLIKKTGEDAIFRDFFSLVSHRDGEYQLVQIRNPEYVAPFLPPVVLSRTSMRFVQPDRLVEMNSPDEGTRDSCTATLSLPFPTVIRVFITCTGRGVPQSGAALYQPLLSDYEAWVKHKNNKDTNTTAHGRRLADWWGDRAQACDDDRNVIGYVTSACGLTHISDTRIAIGFCEALALKRLLYASCERVVGSGSLLILYRNSLSEWFRPALLEIHVF